MTNETTKKEKKLALSATQIKEVTDILAIARHGNQIYKELTRFPYNVHRKYEYAQKPVKIIYKDTLYDGYISVIVMSHMTGVAPFTLYQALRRKRTYSFTEVKNDLYITMNLGIVPTKNNISDFFAIQETKPEYVYLKDLYEKSKVVANSINMYRALRKEPYNIEYLYNSKLYNVLIIYKGQSYDGGLPIVTIALLADKLIKSVYPICRQGIPREYNNEKTGVRIICGERIIPELNNIDDFFKEFISQSNS